MAHILSNTSKISLKCNNFNTAIFFKKSIIFLKKTLDLTFFITVSFLLFNYSVSERWEIPGLGPTEIYFERPSSTVYYLRKGYCKRFYTNRDPLKMRYPDVWFWKQDYHVFYPFKKIKELEKPVHELNLIAPDYLPPQAYGFYRLRRYLVDETKKMNPFVSPETALTAFDRYPFFGP